MIELKTLKDLNLPVLFHNFYEEEADKVGWETNRKCRVDFDELPETNQETMIRTCEKIKDKLKAEAAKWVKDLLDKNRKRRYKFEIEAGYLFSHGRESAEMLKHFFNLTEEDLK
jgi:hypothetical protein